MISNSEFLNSVKATVLSYLPEAKVLLFGSRARGDFNGHSDFDLLVVTKNDIEAREKMNLESKISKSLVCLLNMPFDVLLYSQRDVELKKNAKGLIIYHAFKDAIVL